MRKTILVLLGVTSLAVLLFVFHRPAKRKDHKDNTTTPLVAKSAVRRVNPRRRAPPRRPSLEQLVDAWRRVHGRQGAAHTPRFKQLATLPNGQRLLGVSDGHKAHEGLLPGQIVLLQKRDGSATPFLKGTSIFSVAISKQGWVAAITATSDLVLRTPQGTSQTLRKRAGLWPRFSPSGDHLAYVHRQSIAHHTLIWREIATGKEIALASRGPMSDPVFSPQEDAVIYASGRSGIVSMWKATRDGTQSQLTNRGLTPGQGRPPKGFVPPPAGRYPVLWANHWLVYDAGDGLWAIRDDGSHPYQIVPGHHRPTWDIPGQSVVYFLQGTRKIAQLRNIP